MTNQAEATVTKQAEDILRNHRPNNQRHQNITIRGTDSLKVANEVGEVIDILFENRDPKPTFKIQPLYKNDGSGELVSTTVSMPRDTLVEIQRELGIDHNEGSSKNKSRKPAKHFREVREVSEDDSSVGRLSKMGGRGDQSFIIR